MLNLFCKTLPPPRWDPAAAQHGMPANIVILLDDHDRGAVVARRNGGCEARGSRADDHDVGRKIPFHAGIAFGGGIASAGRILTRLAVGSRQCPPGPDPR